MKYPLLTKALLFLSLFFINREKLFSQLHQWTWTKGDNAINLCGMYGSNGVAAGTNKPGARSESASWKDKTGNFWLFGGIGYGSGNSYGQLNDLWKYNPSTNQWAWIKGPQLLLGNGNYGVRGIAAISNMPSARMMSNSWTDETGNFWLFGGSGSTYFNDLWKYDIATNQWTWIHGDNIGNAHGTYGTQGIPSLQNKPGARNNAVCWTDKAGNLWLFGGNGYGAAGQGGRLGDLWKYNIAGNCWTWMKGDSVIQSLSVYGSRNMANATTKPGARTGASGWSDQSGDLWLFGGIGYATAYGVLNDLWKYNIVSNQWMWVHGDSTVGRNAIYGTTGIPASSNKPGGMLNAVAATDNAGGFWLFGGRGYTNAAFGELNTLWKYNTATNQWCSVKGDNATFVLGEYGLIGIPAEQNKPGAREKPVAWSDSLGNLWLLGGESYPLNNTVTFFHNDLWKFSLGNLLPVTLISFDGKLRYDQVLLSWVVEDEIHLDHYEIERSIDGTEFTTVGSVKAIHAGNYGFTDAYNRQAVTINYRLKIVDIDGKCSRSSIVSFRGRSAGEFTISPNPASNFTQLRFNKTVNGLIEVAISDKAARVVFKRTWNINGNSVNLPVSMLPVGVYSVIIIYKTERFVQNLVVVK